MRRMITDDMTGGVVDATMYGVTIGLIYAVIDDVVDGGVYDMVYVVINDIMNDDE